MTKRDKINKLISDLKIETGMTLNITNAALNFLCLVEKNNSISDVELKIRITNYLDSIGSLEDFDYIKKWRGL